MEQKFYDGIEYESSAELCEKMSAECDTAILSFSTGKDSIAAWLQMRKYFKRIIPYYCYTVPRMQFVEDALSYYEDFFGCHIYRLPHRSFCRFLRDHVDQPPDRIIPIQECGMPTDDEYNDDTIGDIIRRCARLPDGAYAGIGVRMADSPYRRISIKTHGAINHNGKRFFPIYDWKKEDMLAAFDEAGVKLPIDYRMFGRSFDGIDYRFTQPIREWFPEDYELLVEWFPFAELDIARHEGFESIGGRRRVKVEGNA